MSHDHSHAHAHQHGAAAHRGRLAAALAITASILIAEVVGALLTGSLALLVDAAHMLTDALGLGVALVAATLMARPPTNRRTWGWLRAEVLAAGAQATILLGVGCYAVVEGVQRLRTPPDVSAPGLLVFGVIGLLGNVASIVVLSGGRDANLNMRAAFLEVANDALGSVAVLISAGIIAATGWTRADAIAGLLIAALILPRALVIVRDSGRILLESVPAGLDLESVRAHILAMPDVLDLHDLHVSQVSSDLPVLTAHVVVAEDCFTGGRAPALLARLQTCVAEHFPVSVAHSTFQLEPPAHAAAEAPLHGDAAPAAGSHRHDPAFAPPCTGAPGPTAGPAASPRPGPDRATAQEDR